MTPLITIRKSMWTLAWTFVWTLCLSFLIVPVFYLIYKIIYIRKYRTEVFEDRVVDYQGIINIQKREQVLTKILGVSVNKTMVGNMFGYGDLRINLIGKGGLSFDRIANVDEVEAFFKKRIANAETLKQSVIEQ